MNQNPQQASPTSPAPPSRQGPRRAEDSVPGMKSGGADQERELASEVRHVAGDLADKATRSAGRQFASGKERAAQTIAQLADALRETTDRLSSETDMPMISDYLGRAASQFEGLSGYLEETSLTDVVGDVERFARREPILFIGSAFLIGLIGGRFLRSSQPGRAALRTVAQGVGEGR